MSLELDSGVGVFNADFNLKMFYSFTEDDWELAHRKLAGIQNEDAARTEFDDWLRKKGLGSEHDDPKSKSSRAEEATNDDDSENELDREEVLFDFFTTLQAKVWDNFKIFSSHKLTATCYTRLCTPSTQNSSFVFL